MDKQYKTIHPVKYYRDYIAHNLRPDGREFLKHRPAVISVESIGPADGSAIVKIGNTVVVCGIKAELAKPKAEEPDRGFIIPNVELPPLCSSKYRPGPPSDHAQVTSHLVAKIIKDSEFIDLKQLCIVTDKLAWVLYCDMVCTDYDGSITDACILALVAALKTVKLPHVDFNNETNTYTVEEDNKSMLALNDVPIATTFAIFEDSTMIADPTNDEESLCTGIVTVVQLKLKCSTVHKPGGTPLTSEQMHVCLRNSRTHSKKLLHLLQAAIKHCNQDG